MVETGATYTPACDRQRAHRATSVRQAGQIGVARCAKQSLPARRATQQASLRQRTLYKY